MDIIKNGFSEPTDTVKAIFEAAYDNNPANLQKTLQVLKFHDTNPLVAMLAVIWKFKISLADAKEMVLTSEAWRE